MRNFISLKFVKRRILTTKIKRKIYTLIIFNDLPIYKNGGKVIKKILLILIVINEHLKNIRFDITVINSYNIIFSLL